MFLILFNDANYNASEIIAVGSPEKGFIQGFDRVFPEFRKTRLGFRCKNRFFELYFSFSKAPLFLADSMLSPVIFLEESTGFYLNYVGFKHIGGLGLVVLSELCEGALAYFSSAGV